MKSKWSIACFAALFVSLALTIMPAIAEPAEQTQSPAEQAKKEADLSELKKGWEAFTQGDFEKAESIYLPLAQNGNPEAQFMLGNMYRLKKRWAKANDEIAAQWLLKAANQGNKDAQFSISFMYKNGWGVPKNLDESNRWYELSKEPCSMNIGKAKYEGECRGNVPSGIGVMTWPEGSDYKEYVGEFAEGKRTCGKMTFWNKDTYEGCFDAKGRMQGKTAMQLAADAGPRFGAIYYDPETRTHGWSHDGRTESEANKRGEEACSGANEGRSCTKIITFSGAQCGALAVTEQKDWGGAAQPTRSAAESTAMDACRRASGNRSCRVFKTVCTAEADKKMAEAMTACQTAEVPNPNPLADESTSFYGDCRNGKAITGIVVWKIKSQPTAISCLNQEKYEPQNNIDQFEACKQYWKFLPGYCQKGNYNGQCKNGVAHGVGFQSEGAGNSMFGGGALSIKTGQFENGDLHGYGYYASINGCGAAGCSGNLIKETGWFENGKKILDCSTFTECLPKLSGKNYVAQKGALSPDDALKVEKLRKQSSFDSLLEAFNMSGEKSDLKSAERMATTRQQKAQLEYTFMRVAGFDKAMTLSAVARNGKKSVSVDDSEHLLGFVSQVTSDFPVVIDWKLTSNKSLLPLQYGEYSVKIKVGLKVKRKRKTCIGIFCSSNVNVDEYLDTTDVTLSNKKSYKASGTYDLSVKGSNKTSTFIGDSDVTIVGIEPVISIESITLLP